MPSLKRKPRHRLSRPDRRNLRTLAPGGMAPSGPLTVISVTGLDDGFYRFAFSGPVTVNGGDCSAIEIGEHDDQWFPAGGASPVSATEIDVLIGSNGFPDWRILTQPAGITTALAVPMSGSVA
jgi:hypothetical protein